MTDNIDNTDTETDVQFDEEQTRREFMLGAGTAATAATLPFGLESAWLNTVSLSPLAAENIDLFGGLSARDETLLHSDNRVSMHVPFSGSESDIQAWVDESDDRTLVSVDTATETATIIMPLSDVVSRVFSSPSLSDQEWVDTERDIDIRTELSRPEPVDLDDDASVPVSRLERVALGFDNVSPLDKGNGVAFSEDASKGSLRAARQSTNAPDSLVQGAATGNVTVAVIDTGANTAGGAVFGGTTILDASWNAISDTTVAEGGVDAVADGAGHGSHVASTIAADPGNGVMEEYTGYLPGCDLLVIKALGDDGSGNTDNIARAVTYAADQGADLLCMSLGSPVWSVELDRAISYAAGSGVVPFIAAGNARTRQTWVASPADAGDAAAIAAGTIASQPSDIEIAYFSNIGPDPGTRDLSGGATEGSDPDLAGPGMKLDALVADSAGDTSFKALSGTSMATPCVVGAAGLVLAETSVGADDLVAHMQDHAQRLEQAGVHEAGAGYPDVDRAINGTATADTQETIRTDEAQTRDTAYERLSDAQGGFLAGLF
ncbi:Subtilase family protein [Halovenus aranensis]|uniref:Subtilase family protein n=1 Tax=Halovenus aranensis TaxID=890420 RepID=A0A1G8SWS0_9EURY|nr:S8 family serine peptidase [Halovenus aranensis]SDJ33000.1 Subtilase family protein [Halovenus aranensis]